MNLSLQIWYFDALQAFVICIEYEGNIDIYLNVFYVADFRVL